MKSLRMAEHLAYVSCITDAMLFGQDVNQIQLVSSHFGKTHIVVYMTHPVMTQREASTLVAEDVLEVAVTENVTRIFQFENNFLTSKMQNIDVEFLQPASR
jgi:phosphoribosylpyrophosphate synthetase